MVSNDVFRFFGFPLSFNSLKGMPEEGRIYINTGRAISKERSALLEIENRIKPSFLKENSIYAPFPEIYESISGYDEVLAEFSIGGKRFPAITIKNGAVIFNFDPNKTLEFLMRYNSMNRNRPAITRMPIHPHRLSGRQRSLVKRILHTFQRKDKKTITWNSSDVIRWTVKACAGIVNPSLKETPFWPAKKKYAVILSHDVDSDWIFKRKNYEMFAGLEESNGFCSSWNIVTNKYPIDFQVLNILRDRGHEIAFHDYNHDLKTTFLSEKKMLERFEKSKWFIERYNVSGTRTAACFKTERFFRIARHFLSYDSSYQDSNLKSGLGCYSVFPFFIGDMLEIPITLPEDTQFVGDPDSKKILSIMRKKTEYVKSIGGLISISIHPETEIGANDKWLGIYEKLLRDLSKDRGSWTALHKDIDIWWRNRMNSTKGPGE